MLETLHHLMKELVEYAILFLEFTGVMVVVIASLLAIYRYIKKDPHTRLKLCRAMAMALEFKLGGEILRTVIVREFSEVLLVGCMILLRAGLTFLIHWAISTEEAEEEEYEEHCRKHIETMKRLKEEECQCKQK